MIIHLLDAHAGRHAVGAAAAAAAAAKSPFFRRMRLRRRPAATEAPGLASVATTGLTTAQQQAHADAMHAKAARYLPAPPRPVNGRYLGTLPRLTTPDSPPWDIPTAAQPVYNEAPQLDVAAAEQAKNDAARAWYQTVPPAKSVLEQVLDGLRNLPGDRPGADYRGGWQ